MERVFDFSKPRVRLNGRSLSKFDVAWQIEHLVPAYTAYSNMTIMCDAFSYAEVVDILKEILEA